VNSETHLFMTFPRVIRGVGVGGRVTSSVDICGGVGRE
jgi:hypothetical protein